MTGFFGVHLALTVVSLVLGTTIGLLGVRGLTARRAAPVERGDVDRRTPAPRWGTAVRR